MPARPRYVYYADVRWPGGKQRGVYRSKRAMLRWVEWVLGTEHVLKDTGEIIVGRIPLEEYEAGRKD